MKREHLARVELFAVRQYSTSYCELQEKPESNSFVRPVQLQVNHKLAAWLVNPSE